MSEITYLTPEQVANYRSKVDLTDKKNGTHAINLVMAKVVTAIAAWAEIEPTMISPDPVVSVRDNFDRLFYPCDAVARDPRYTHYVDKKNIFRTQMTAAIPPYLYGCIGSDEKQRFVAAHGLVYRRDVIDRSHVGEPHQLDLWVLKNGWRYTREDMLEMIKVVLDAIIPNCEYRVNETFHPYTMNGLEVEVFMDDKWVEVLECGQAHPWLLKDCDLADWSGLAMGIGLDRLVMLLKGITDIRLLRSPDIRVAAQMVNLEPYRKVSSQAPIWRDMSICVYDDDLEVIGDKVRQALGDKADWLEEIVHQESTAYNSVPERARERLGMVEGQWNMLIRLVLRSPTESIPKPIANEIYEIVYKAVHEGTAGYIKEFTQSE